MRGDCEVENFISHVPKAIQINLSRSKALAESKYKMQAFVVLSTTGAMCVTTARDLVYAPKSNA